MPPKYRTIPAAEVECEGSAFSSTNIESFELEDSFTIVRTDRSIRRKFACIVTCLLVLFVVAIGYGVHGYRKSPQQETSANDVNSVSASVSEQDITENEDVQSASNDENNIKEQQPTVTPKLIYCYGDSLTYGMVPSSREAYPYAPYLEQELNFLYKNSTSQSYKNNNATKVKHFGYPGWTATNMLDHINDTNIGICDIIQNNSDIALMIILVGTNDIGILLNSSGDIEDVARTIVNSIIELHNSAFTCANDVENTNFHTLALGIPGSSFQERVPAADGVARSINKSLKEFASLTDDKISYIDFPIQYEKNGPEWGKDGLHMSPEGYHLLGKELAPHVKLILGSIDL